MQPVVSCSQECSLTVILLNLFITGSCCRFDVAVVGGWLHLVKLRCARLLPLGADAAVWLMRRAVWIFFFAGSAAFIQRPEGERSILIQLSVLGWHEFEQLEMTKSHKRLCLRRLEFDCVVGANALDLKAVPTMRSFVDKMGRGKEKENFSYTGQWCCCAE